jgi:Na+/melibiose symporter-like transporter
MSSWSSFFADEVALQVGATVLTNLTMIPGIVQSLRKRTFYELALLSATMFTSIMYHMADTVKTKIWGMYFFNCQKKTNAELTLYITQIIRINLLKYFKN